MGVKQIKDAGVKVYVFGQALADNGFKPEWVDDNVTVALSALTAIATYELQGFAHLQF